MRQRCLLILEMKVFVPLLFIFTFSDILLAYPIPESQNKRSISIPWKKYLPTLGAVGLVGTLAAIIFLGTKADEAYKAVKTVEQSEADAKFLALPVEDQVYFMKRMQSLGKVAPGQSEEKLEAQDLIHGWPKLEMPETAGMDKSTRRELEAVHRKLEIALNEVATTQENLKKAETEVSNAQFSAGVLALTEWRQALKKAKAQFL
jgi:hypothetical protein